LQIFSFYLFTSSFFCCFCEFAALNFKE